MKVSLEWPFVTKRKTGADTCRVARCYEFYVLGLISLLVTVPTAAGLAW